MPSRMSCSLTTSSSIPARLRQFARQLLDDDRAAADHVDAALVHRAERSALLAGHRDQVVAHRQQIVETRPGTGGSPRRRRSAIRWASADSVVIVPATPTQVRAPVDGHDAAAPRQARRAPRSAPRRSRRPSAGPSAGSVRSAARSRCRRSSSPSPRGRPPPPRWSRRRGRPRRKVLRRHPIRRPHRRKDSAASSVPVITSATAPGTHRAEHVGGHREELVAVGRVAGGRRRDHPHPSAPRARAAASA